LHKVRNALFDETVGAKPSKSKTVGASSSYGEVTATIRSSGGTAPHSSRGGAARLPAGPLRKRRLDVEPTRDCWTSESEFGASGGVGYQAKATSAFGTAFGEPLKIDGNRGVVCDLLDLLDEDVDDNDDMHVDVDFHSPEIRVVSAGVPMTLEVPFHDESWARRVMSHDSPGSTLQCDLPSPKAQIVNVDEDSTVPTWRDWGGRFFPSYHDEPEETQLTLDETQNIDKVVKSGRALWIKWDEAAEHEQFIADGASIGATLRTAAAMITEHTQTV
jgi:hypothetical protein